MIFKNAQAQNRVLAITQMDLPGRSQDYEKNYRGVYVVIQEEDGNWDEQFGEKIGSEALASATKQMRISQFVIHIFPTVGN